MTLLHRKPATCSLTVTRIYRTSSEQVFDAWITPQSVRQWLFATPDGDMLRSDVDARVGGGFTITERRGKQDVEHKGRYLELIRPYRLAFAFSVPQFSATETIVRIAIQPQDEGCQLSLTHEGVRKDFEERTRNSWAHILDGLEKSLH